MPMPPRTPADPSLLAPGTIHTSETLTQAARAAWEASRLTQVVAAERMGCTRVTFAHAVGEPTRKLDALRIRIVEAFTPGVRIEQPLYRVVAAEDAGAATGTDAT